jgi:hypothetical protein
MNSDVKTALERIVEIAYEGHPDGRADRLTMITRYAQAALTKLGLGVRSDLQLMEDIAGHLTDASNTLQMVTPHDNIAVIAQLVQLDLDIDRALGRVQSLLAEDTRDADS